MMEKRTLIFCIGLLIAVPVDSVHINTSYGTLRGKVETVPEFGTVSQFLGVPYAAPPVDHLRFKPPVQYPNWSGIRNATKFGKVCMQSVISNSSDDIENMSEDCLFLNIYVPSNLDNCTRENQSLPIMLWIHGGGYTVGAGSQYSGDLLALHGNVIVVTINYRLGVFGFLSTRTKEAPGNAGLHDMRMALKWVRDNSQNFCGDESKITIFGESAGGSAVNYLTLSPLTKGLYARAISQSGTVFAPWGIQKNPLAHAEVVGKALGCSTLSTEDMIQCLRNVSAQELFDRSLAATSVIPYDSKPSVDGVFIPHDPITLMETGQINPGEYMTGSNSLEANLFENLTFFGPAFGQTYEENTKETVSTFFKKKHKIMEGIRLTYGAPGANFSIENRDVFLDILGDSMFVSPSEKAAICHSRTGQKTFSYMFSHAISTSPPKRGASHADEIVFVFGIVSYLFPNVTNEERELGKTMMNAWVDFAKYGNPGWTVYDEQSRSYVDFELPASNLTTKTNLWPRRMALWNDLVPAIEKETSCDARPIRETTNGKVRGARKIKDGMEWEEYLGIPYAAPPVGKWRFRPSQDVSPWQGIYDASKYGYHCPQPKTLLDQLLAAGVISDTATSEDCLTLNVFIPQGLANPSQTLLPIMVFIHGGGFFSTSAERYEAHMLATHGNVIIVKINYRLGALGFLATYNSEYSGNYGLMDQLAALRWVKKNAQAFGGDPDKITIFGSSAGGVSVALLAVSPLTEGLFQRAISMSGDALAPFNQLNFRDRQIKRHKNFAEALGCPTYDDLTMVKCLQEKSLNDLIPDVVESSIHILFGPVVDYKIVPENAYSLFNKGKSAHVDYLLGFTSGELGVLPYGYMFGRNYSLDVWDSFKGFIKIAASNATLHPDAVAAAAVSHYFPVPPKSNEEFVKGATELLSDWSFGASFIETADLHTKMGGKAYFFVFSHVLSAWNFPEYVGSPHTEQVRFLFGALPSFFKFTPEERELSKVVMTYWTNFVKTGDPNKGMDVPVHWPKYNVHTRQYMDFTTAMNSSSVKANYKASNMRLWNKLVKQIQAPCEDIPSMGTTSPASVVSHMTTSPSPITPTGKEKCNLEVAAGLRMSAQNAGAVIWGLTGATAALLVIAVLLAGWGCKVRRQLKKIKRSVDTENHTKINPVFSH